MSHAYISTLASSSQLPCHRTFLLFLRSLFSIRLFINICWIIWWVCYYLSPLQLLLFILLTNTVEKTSIQDKIILYFVQNKSSCLYLENFNTNPIKKVLLLILLCLTKKQLNGDRNCYTTKNKSDVNIFSSKSFA